MKELKKLYHTVTYSKSYGYNYVEVLANNEAEVEAYLANIAISGLVYDVVHIEEVKHV